MQCKDCKYEAFDTHFKDRTPKGCLAVNKDKEIIGDK